MKKLSTAAKVLISGAILLFLFRKASLDKTLHLAFDINWFFIFLSVLIIILAQIVRAYRLGVMLFDESAGSTFLRVLRVQMVSFLPGIISPAKIGEATKIYMLQKETGAPLGRATACFVAERVLDMLLLVPLAIVGLYTLLDSSISLSIRSGSVYVMAIAAVGAAAAVPVAFAFFKRRGMSLARTWQAAAPSRLIEASLVTAVYWGLVFLEVWFFCKAALFAPPIRQVALSVPPALLSSLLPITFSGFGIREAALVFLLQRPSVGATYNQALLVSLFYIVFGLGVPALIGISYWLLGKKHVDTQA